MTVFDCIVKLMNVGDPAEYVRGVYRELLHREADPGGLAGHINLMSTGTTRLQVVSGIMLSAESRALLGQNAQSPSGEPTLHVKLGQLVGGTYAQFVQGVYKEMLHRSCGPHERVALLSHLLRGNDRLFMVSEVLRAPEFIEKLRSHLPYLPL